MNHFKKIVAFICVLCLMTGIMPVEANAMDNEENVEAFYDIPHYFQNDYPNVRYGKGTIASEGCGITSVAMVASFLTGYEYLPDTLASWFGQYGYNNVDRVEYASKTLQLPFRRAKDINEIVSELKEGNIAIALMNSKSKFTGSQHFIVLTGITEAGRILVQDSYAPNYSSWDLKEGFDKGFTKEFLINGFSGGWVYDVHAMQAVPFIYDPAAEQAQTVVEHWKKMPTYYQNDYPDVRFGRGTVASSGCVVTSLAMVASYMTKHEYLPDTLADWFGGYGENNIKRLEYASDKLQLPYKKARNIHEIFKEVRAGNLAILLMNSKSIFTSSQHFIVLSGVTKDGKFMVKDSYAPNYENQELKDSFASGFTEKELIKGYDGGWIYQLNDMPENPFIYEEEKTTVESRYPGIELTWEEQQLLAKLIWLEARGESAKGQQAVAEVVLNRMISQDYPNTLHEVIYQEGQFRSVKLLETATPWQTQYDALDKALEGPYVLPLNVYHFDTQPIYKRVWGTIGGHTFYYG